MRPLIDLLPLEYTDAVVVLGAAILGLAAGVLGELRGPAPAQPGG